MTDRRTRRVIAENAEPIQTAHGDEQPWAEVAEDLTWGELKALRSKAPLQGATYDEAGAAIAPFVVGWNLLARNTETGELEPLAPPAEDAKSFDCVEPWVISWLFVTMHNIHVTRDETKKKLTTSDPTPAGTSDGDSSSPTPASSPSDPTTTSS